MSSFEAVEIDVVIRTKIVTYQPKWVVDNQIKVLRAINEALSNAGKELEFLPSPATLILQQGESK